MKNLVLLMVMASQFLYSQNNVALFHTEGIGEVNYNEYKSDVTIAPFELLQGMIVVQAKVNGEMGSFILDTGAPSMVIDKKEKSGEKVAARGVGGEMTVGKTELREFSFGNIHRKDLESYVLDISQLEINCGRDLMGLIGYDILQQYELLFDYAQQLIHIYPANETAGFHKNKASKVIPFVLHGHVPVVVVKIGGKKAYLGVDSGAAVNLLDQDYLSKIEDSHLADVCEEWLTGLDNQKHLVVAADVRQSSIKGNEFPAMRYLFTDMSSIEEHFGSRLDGLLGYPFFKSQKISINYKKRKIYVW